MIPLPRTLGIITARDGSKGIPQKNFRQLCGRPLIAYTIDAARGSRHLTRCIVSTDSEEIADIAHRLGANVPFLRPAELATDSALALAVLQHAIHWIEEHEGETYEYTMMLQPTSPLRTSADIDACIELAARKNADSVFSMKRLPDFAPQKLKTIDDEGYIRPLLMEEQGQSAPRHRGQDVFKRNCAIYLTRTSLILQGDQFGTKQCAHVMPEERSIDINEPVDFDLAAFWLHTLHPHAPPHCVHH